MSAFLTIAIPTYNRAPNVDLLLTTLFAQIEGLESQVKILISDNCSTDDTATVIASFADRYPDLGVIQNSENIGADRNIAQCFSAALTPYVWIMGDDDVPKYGLIERLLDLFAQEHPDVVYITSEWIKEIRAGEIGVVDVLSWRRIDQLTFARDVNVWSTFISGVIVNKQSLLARLTDFKPLQYSGTSFVQLGWVLGALKVGESFLFIKTAGILATSGNSGGYSVIEAFGVNYPSVVRDIFCDQPSIAKIFVNRCLLRFLPGLIWGTRFKTNVGRFIFEFPQNKLERVYGTNWLYRYLVHPIGTAPKAIAWASFIASRVLRRLL